MLNVQGRTKEKKQRLFHALMSAMKYSLLVTFLFILSACSSMRTFLPQRPPECVLPPNATYTQIINHLNSQTAGVYGWQSPNVRIKARQKGGIPISLNAMLAAEQPKRFRLLAKSPLGAEVDFGSNNERFWFWAKRSDQKRVFTIRHDQYQSMGSQLNIPFEPDWILEALRIIPINEQELEIRKEGQNSPNIKLISDRLLPNGKLVQKIIVVNLCTGNIIEQSLFDSQGQRLATATLGEYRVCTNSNAVLPHVIKLDWPQAGVVLTMTMANIEVNPASVPPEVWGLPQYPGYPVMDLGANFPMRQEASIKRPSRIDSRVAELEEPDWSGGNSNSKPEWKPSQIEFEEPKVIPVIEEQTQELENPFRTPDSFTEPEEAPGRVRI